MLNHDLLNYRTDLFKIDYFSKLIIWHERRSSFFLLIPFQKIFLTKKLTLELDSAASGGDQGKFIYFMYFVLPPSEAGLAISLFCILR